MFVKYPVTDILLQDILQKVYELLHRYLLQLSPDKNISIRFIYNSFIDNYMGRVSYKEYANIHSRNIFFCQYFQYNFFED